MYPNFLVALGGICLEDPVFKSLVIILGLPFECGGILLLSASTLFINLNGMGKVLGYLIARLVLGRSPIGAKFGLVNHTK